MSSNEDTGTAVPMDMVLRSETPALLENGNARMRPRTLIDASFGANLLRKESSGVRFGHQLLQEYFTAVRLSELGLGQNGPPDWLRHERWDETVLLLAGLTSEIDRLIRELIPLSPFLAARCAGLRTDLLSSDVAGELVAKLAGLALDTYGPWTTEAIEALGASRLAAALPVLARIHAADLGRNRQTFRAIGALGTPEAMALLMEYLDHEDGFVRLQAAQVLGEARAREALPKLIERLRKDDAHIRQVANPVFWNLWTPEDVPDLLRLLRDESWTVRWAATRGLGWVRARSAVGELTALLRSASHDLRTAAAESLRYLGPEARVAVPLLSEQLLDHRGDARVRLSAFEALVDLATPEDIPRLLEWLQDREPVRCSVAMESLGKLKAPEAIPGLLQMVREGPGYQCERAIKALVLIGATEAAPALAKILGQPEFLKGDIASEAIVQLGGRQAIPLLLDVLRQQGVDRPRQAPETVESISRSLDKLWTREDVPSLLDQLRDPNWALRRAAVPALARMEVAEALPLVLERLRDPSTGPEELWQLAWAFKKAFGPETVGSLLEVVPRINAVPGFLEDILPKTGVPFLRALLEDPNINIREVAVTSLGMAGTPDAVPVLLGALRDDKLRTRAIQALGKLGAPELLPYFVMSFQAAEGYTPAQVTAALLPLRSHPDWWVKRRVIRRCEELRKAADWPRQAEEEKSGSARASLYVEAVNSGRVLTIIPGWPQALIGNAQALRRLGCFVLALQTLRARPHGPAEDFETAVELERAKCLLALGLTVEFEKAREWIEPRIHDSSAMEQWAELLERRGAVDEAESLYTRAIHNPSQAVCRHYRARAAFYMRRSRYDDAEADARTAANQEPRNGNAGFDDVRWWHPGCELQEGQLALARGMFEKALKTFQAAAVREPTGHWRYGVSLARLGLGQTEEAQGGLAEALERTELHEQIQSALQDLDMLRHNSPGLPGLVEVQRQMLSRKAAIDGFAASDEQRLRFDLPLFSP
jgi:HEAT repeat protein/tetratricopeptide (TPR) repeat protein